MTDLDYSFRINRFATCKSYRQDVDTLYWTDGRREGRLAYKSIDKVRNYKVRYWGSSATYWRCELHSKSGPTVYLQAAHYVGFRRIEDRTDTYIPFIKQLETRIAADNPDATFHRGRHWLAAFEAVGGLAIVWMVRLLRYANLERIAALAGWLMRKIGPWLRGHRAALDNLRAAYPEKTAAEIDSILLGMWDNMGRIFVEYSQLSDLYDYNPERPELGRILVDPASRARCLKFLETKGPILMFGAHLANWELLVWGIGSRRHGELAVVYRPPRIGSVEQEFARIRSRSSTILIPADAEALIKIKAALQRGTAVGILIDEHFSRGVETTFFGRPCKVSPVLALFARRFDCPVFGARIIRLPNEKFRLDISDPIVPPRDENGKIDVTRTMQMITSIVEGWIREHPEQWNWMQRRWR